MADKPKLRSYSDWKTSRTEDYNWDYEGYKDDAEKRTSSPEVSQPQLTSYSTFKARKSINVGTGREGVEQSDYKPMPSSNTEYWEKGMPRTAANQNKPTNDINPVKAITDIGASVLKGLTKGAIGDTVKTVGRVAKNQNSYISDAVNEVNQKMGERQPEWTKNYTGQNPGGTTFDYVADKAYGAADKLNRQSKDNSNFYNQNLSVAESLGQMVGNIGLTALTKVPTPVLMGMQSGQSTYDELKKQGMDENEAALRATVSGAIEGGSEYIGGGETITKVLKGQWKELLSKTTKEAAEDAMQRTLGHKVWDFVKDEVMGEALQEAGTEVAHQVADASINAAYGRGFDNDPNTTMKDNLANIGWSAYGGGIMGAIGGGARTGIQAIVNAPGIGQAAVLEDTGDAVIVQTEDGQVAPVRKMFLQNADVQEVPQTQPEIMQDSNANPSENILTPEQQMTESVKAISQAKEAHEAGNVETKNYLDTLAVENNKIEASEPTTSSEPLQATKDIGLPNTRQTQNKGITEALMNEDGQTTIKKIQEDMKRSGIDANIQVIKGSTGFHKDIRNIAKGLGVNVVFYKGDKVPNGFMSSKVSNTIFIHSSGEKNDMVATTGHEFLHHFKATYKENFSELLDFAKTYFTNEARQQFLETYKNVPELQKQLSENENDLLEEMLADEMGNNFVDKNFWQRVYEHSKELFEKMVEAAQRIVKNFTDEDKVLTFVAKETAETLSKKMEEAIAHVRKQVAEGKVDTEARIEDNEGLQFNASAREKEQKDELTQRLDAFAKTNRIKAQQKGILSELLDSNKGNIRNVYVKTSDGIINVQLATPIMEDDKIVSSYFIEYSGKVRTADGKNYDRDTQYGDKKLKYDFKADAENNELANIIKRHGRIIKFNSKAEKMLYEYGQGNVDENTDKILQLAIGDELKAYPNWEVFSMYYRDKINSMFFNSKGAVKAPDAKDIYKDVLAMAEADEKTEEDKKTKELTQSLKSTLKVVKNSKEKSQDLKLSTRSKEFKQWFGDSKVVDENGEPMVVYHGTNQDVTEFKKESIGGVHGDKIGFFFINDKSEANSEAFAAKMLKGGEKTIIQTYLKIEKPLIIKAYDLPNADYSYGHPTNAYDSSREYVQDELGKNDFDGVIIKGQGEYKGTNMYIAFEPTQIKSATGNNGNYDASNPDIRESVRQKERQHAWKQYDGSDAMDNEVYKRIPPEVKKLPETMSIKSVFEEANARVKADPQTYVDKVRNSDHFAGPVEVAEAESVLLLTQQAAQQYEREGNKARAEQQYNIAVSIASKIITHFTETARTLNMGKLWRMLTPEGVIKVMEKAIEKESTPKERQRIKSEANDLLKTLNALDSEKLKSLMDALGYEKLTSNEIIDEVESERESNFDEMDERVKEVAELFDTIEARNAKKIANKVKDKLKDIMEGIDLGIKFMARGLDLNKGESISDRLNKLVEEHYSKPLAERGNLAKEISKLLGITMDKADMVAQRINDTMKEVTRDEKLKALKDTDSTEAKRSAIENWLNPKERKKPEVKSWIDRMLALSEEGLLTREDLMPLVAAKYGIKVMTPEISSNLFKLAETIQSKDKDSNEYNQAVNDLNDYMNSIVKHDAWEYVNMIQNLSLLSGTKSMMRNDIGNIARLFTYNMEETMKTLMDIVQYYSGKTVGLKTERHYTMPNPIKQGKGLAQGFLDNIKDIIKDIDTTSVEDNREFSKYVKFKRPKHIRSPKDIGRYVMNVWQSFVKFLMTDRPFTQAMLDDMTARMEKLAKVKGIEYDADEGRQIAEDTAAKTFFNGDDALINGLLKGRKWLNQKSLELPAHILGNKDYKASGQWGLGSVVFTFMKVPYNVSKFAVEREWHLAASKVIFRGMSTAYGAFKKKDNAGYISDGKFDADAFMDDITKGLSGAMIMYLGTWLLSNGLVHVRPDDEDKDKKLSALGRLLGTNKYQLNISAVRRFFQEGGKQEKLPTDTLATLDWFTPLSTLMIAGIKAQIMKEERKVNKADKDMSWDEKALEYITEKASALVEGVGEQIDTVLELPMLQSVKKLTSSNVTGTADVVWTILKDVPTRFIPAPVKYARQLTDNNPRETYSDSEWDGMKRTVRAALPKASKSLEPRIDMFGDDVKYRNSILDVMVNPSTMTKYSDDPDALKMQEVYERFGIKDQIPPAIDKKWTISKKDYPKLKNDTETIILSPSEYTYFQREYGKKAREAVHAMSIYETKESMQTEANKVNRKFSEAKAAIKEKILEQRGIK